MKIVLFRGLAAACCVMACGAKADAEIVQYLIEFDQSGDVALGSTLDWTLSVVVTDSDAGNFGIRTASVDLVNSTAEPMSGAVIAAPFSDYQLPNDGTLGPPPPGELHNVGAGMITYVAASLEGVDPANGGDLGPIVLATGSYVVNTLGLHTLSTMMSASESFYFTAASTASFQAYEGQLFDSDSVNVVAAVPEPSSMLLASTLLCPGLIGARRRRRRRIAESAS